MAEMADDYNGVNGGWHLEDDQDIEASLKDLGRYDRNLGNISDIDDLMDECDIFDDD